MISLFSALAESNTQRTGEVFVRLATDDHKKEVVTSVSRACVGIGYV